MRKQKFSSKSPMISDKDANIIGGYIQNQFNGNVTPEELLKSAKKKKSVIHKYFDWDDTSAANKYRRSQAYRILNSIVVVVEDIPVKAFHNVFVKEERSNRFINVNEARKNNELWEQVVQQALDEIILWKEKYKDYVQLAPIVSAIEATELTINN